MIAAWLIAVSTLPLAMPMTSSWRQDAVARAITDGRFDDADFLVRRWGVVDDARAAAAAARVEVARVRRSGRLEVGRVDEHAAAVVQLLADYPSHPRKPFLREVLLWTRLTVLRDAVRLGDDVTRELIRLGGDVDESASRAASMSQTTADADAVTLWGRLLVMRCEVALTLVETNPPGADRVAAASAAVESINRSLDRLPINSPAARTLRTRRDAASIEAGRTIEPTATDRDDAGWIAAALANVGRWDGLRAWLDRWPVDPPDERLDLARLRLLLATGDDAAVEWLSRIEGRSGVGAARRAEAVVAASLGGDADVADPALLAAVGRERLRAGRFVAAADCLSRAAEFDPTFAAEAFAARVQSGELDAALDWVGTLDDPAAATVDYAAIHAAAGRRPARVADLLDRHAERFPGSPHADDVRRWRRSIREAAGDLIGVAMLSGGDIDAWTAALVDADDATWRRAEVFLDHDDVDEALVSMAGSAATLNRRGLSRSEDFASPLVRRRWIRDGRLNRSRRATVADAVRSRDDAGWTTMQLAEAEVWAGRDAAAADRLRAWIGGERPGADEVFAAAELLADRRPREAVTLLDALATRSRRGGEVWQRARARAIEITRSFDPAGADRRAAFLDAVR